MLKTYQYFWHLLKFFDRSGLKEESVVETKMFVIYVYMFI